MCDITRGRFIRFPAPKNLGGSKMAKYEISDKVKGAIMQIVAGASIKGADAPIVVEIANTLQTPIIEPKIQKDIK